MLTVTTVLTSKSPISFSKLTPHTKAKNEDATAYEERIWRDRCHFNGDEHIIIPGIFFQRCIQESGPYLGMKVEGRGNATFTKHMKGGVQVLNNIDLPQTRDTVESEWLFLHGNPTRGDKAGRVMKCMPVVREWTGTVEWLITDPVITPDVFLKHLQTAGLAIGIGRWRPTNGGQYGRFEVTNIEFTDDDE